MREVCLLGDSRSCEGGSLNITLFSIGELSIPEARGNPRVGTKLWTRGPQAEWQELSLLDRMTLTDYKVTNPQNCKQQA